MIIVGIILLNEDALRLSANGKILLKQIHVVLGYVMGLNSFGASPIGRAPMAGEAKTLRCAIYTRKSTEHGLEQEFNSWMPNGRPARLI